MLRYLKKVYNLVDNKRSRDSVSDLKSKFILLLADMITIVVSLLIGYIIANLINYTIGFSSHTFLNASYGFFYIIIPFVFFYEGIYTRRYDFWHELRLIIKGLLLSLVMIFAYLSLTKEVQEHSRSVIIISFFIMSIFIPIIKVFTKKKLFEIGLWKLGVKILHDDPAMESMIFNDPYLGYMKSSRKEASIVFINSQNCDIELVKKQLEEEISSKSKVMFLPVFNNYQFSNSDIYELNNSRTNLVVLENKLSSKYRKFVNTSYNYILAFILLPLLLPIIGIIAFLIKKDSKGPVFFMQERLGLDGRTFLVFKFRTMHVNGDEILNEYLKDNPKEKENYEIYCKYDKDPRITKIGRILRNTSADELAQIFNVVKGEMNFVGPRPYMVTEKEKIGATNADVILKTKPGITGLWQVSGRNDLSFEDRVKMDKWYIYNWSLWKDFVILIKTVNVVLNRSGAK